MKIVMFYHSLRSDWNHGNAHFLRGIVTELSSRGHKVVVYEPQGAWSVQNLVAEHGPAPIAKFQAAYPGLSSIEYDPEHLDLDQALEGAQLVLVHEWNSPALIQRIGRHRQQANAYDLLFHDTHHRMVSDPQSMSALDLQHYDGVLAYGRILQQRYLESNRVQKAWTWHEAADTRVFRPMPSHQREGDFVWVGNWGDDERTAELQEFLIQPIKRLRASARVYGVRYPDYARQALADAGIAYAGWLPNFEVPETFARFRATIHVPRRPYVEALPGIPTIRPFEALACGIPLISSPWDDAENLFRPGRDYLVARNGQEMEQLLKAVLTDEALASELVANGLMTIRSRHTCAHRVDELLAIHSEIRGAKAAAAEARQLPEATPARAVLTETISAGACLAGSTTQSSQQL